MDNFNYNVIASDIAKAYENTFLTERNIEFNYGMPVIIESVLACHGVFDGDEDVFFDVLGKVAEAFDSMHGQHYPHVSDFINHWIDCK